MVNILLPYMHLMEKCVLHCITEGLGQGAECCSDGICRKKKNLKALILGAARFCIFKANTDALRVESNFQIC